MDIWSWVSRLEDDLTAAGHADLARALSEFPDQTLNAPREQVEAAYPELLAGARALNHGWMEVFVRHWYAQGLSRWHVAGQLLAESVANLEFAHRDDTRDCPQSRCSVQDVCLGYAEVDGPGWTAERRAVVDEAMGTIDPSWPCWICLSEEYADALADEGRHAEAADYVSRQLAAARVPVSVEQRLDEVKHLLAAGRYAAAGDVLETQRARVSEPRERTQYDIQRARVLVGLGRADEAAAFLPPADAAERDHLQIAWTDTWDALVASGAVVNTWSEGARVLAWAATFHERGTQRKGFELAATAARWAVGRGSRTSAHAALSIAERAAAMLRRPAMVAERLGELRAAVASVPYAQDAPVPADQLLAHLDAREGDADPERDLDWLAAARVERPDDDALAARHAQALAACGRRGEAAEMLWPWLEQRPGGELTALTLATLVRGSQDDTDRLCQLVEAEQAESAEWFRALRAHYIGRLDLVCDSCARIVAMDDGVVNTRRLWADAARALGRFGDELRVRREILARVDAAAADDDRWNLMVPATIEGAWAEVRDIAHGLGMPVEPGDAPIEESWGLIEVVTAAGHGGQPERLVAQRSGPVTARIVAVAGMQQPQCFGDVVVFHPWSVEAAPTDEAERAAWRPPYRQVTVLRPGGCATFDLEGPHPGEDAWVALVDAVRPMGVELRRFSSEHFRLADAEIGDEVLGIYGVLAVLPEADLAAVAGMVEAITATWPRPVFWPKLADATGRDGAAHRALSVRYGDPVD